LSRVSDNREMPMLDFPLNAKVECTDGYAGRSSHIVINPITKQLTHFVVQHEHQGETVDRLVPMDKVVETTPSVIRLSVTQDELAGMAPFTQSQYLKVDVPDYDYIQAMPYHALPTKTVDKLVTEELIPPDELAVRRGAKVEALDGSVGQVEGFLVDPESGHISHVLLRGENLLGKREVALPMSAIESVHEDIVFLKLKKQAIQSLPHIPIQRHQVLGELVSVELLAKIFDELEEADKALKSLKELQKKGTLKVQNAAVLVKDDDGKTDIRETGDVDVKGGRLFGAVTGGLIGLLGGPVGVVVGAAAGAGVGGLAAKRIDTGFSDEFLATFQERLQPGNSALIVLVEGESAEVLSEAWADQEGVILREALTDEMVEQLVKASEAEG
jgi:uncharacterized membrane protein/sporulation protein YlmC with PRC-barrel domain